MKTYKANIKIFSVLISLIFILFSTGVLCEQQAAIIVNGDKIFQDDYDYAFSKYIESFKRYYGQTLDEATTAKMKKDLIDDIITKQLYIQQARRRGMTAKVFAGEEEIDDLVMRDPVFMKDGMFDEEKYDQYTIETSQEIKQIRDRAEEVILSYKIRQILPSKVIAAMKEDLTSASAEVVDEYLKRAEKMKAKYIKVDAISIANNTALSEDKIKGYYDSHKDEFRSPPFKKYAVLFFDAADQMNMVSVSEDMISEYYRDHPNEYMTEKEARVKYVIFRTKEYTRGIYDLGVNLKQYYEENIDKLVEPAEAKVKFISIKKPCDIEKVIDLEVALNKGMPFAELARKYSDDQITAARGGDLGYIRSGTLKEPFNGIAFGLKAGEVSGLIETDTGYYIVAVDEKKDERIRPFMEVKDELEDRFLAEAAKPIAEADAKRFRVDAKRSGFEAAAGKKKKTIFETGFIKASEYVPMIGRNVLFSEAALSMPVGAVSGVIEVDGGSAVLKVSEVKPQDYLSLADVHDDIGRKIANENSKLFALNSAKHALSLLSEKVPVSEISKRMNIHISYFDISATAESPANLDQVIEGENGYRITLFMEDRPSVILDLALVSSEAAVSAAMEEADKIALSKAEAIYSSNTTEGWITTPYYSKGDYLIGSDYMAPFIERSFQLNPGDKSIIKSMNKYYVMEVLEKGQQLGSYENESPVIRSLVLREKRDKYVKDWLEKERDRSEIQINI